MLALVAGVWFFQDYLDGQQQAITAKNMSTIAESTTMNTSSKLVLHPMLDLVNDSAVISNGSSFSFSAVMSAAMQFKIGPVPVAVVPMQEVMGIVDLMNRTPSMNMTPISVPISGNLCAADGVTCIALKETARLIHFEEFENGEIEVRATIVDWDDNVVEAHCSPAEDSFCELEFQSDSDSPEIDDEDHGQPRMLWGRRRRRRRRTGTKCCPHGECTGNPSSIHGSKCWHLSNSIALYGQFDWTRANDRDCYISTVHDSECDSHPNRNSHGNNKGCCKRDHSHRRRWCFPSSSRVQLADGTWKQIAAFQHGDQVSVLDDAGDVRQESFLVDFHKGTVEIVEYLELIHQWGSIRISANHLIYVGGKMLPAMNVSIGDKLLWLPGLQKSPMTSTVKKIRMVMDVGFHAPLTFSGNLFIDGILVSCYALVHSPSINAYMQQSLVLKPLIDNAHAVEHFLMYPLRLGYCLKVHYAVCQMAPTLCSDELVYGEKTNLHVYARFVIQIFDQVMLRGTF